MRSRLQAGRPARARRTVLLGLAVAATLGACACACLVAFRHVLVHMFTSDRDIAEAAYNVLPVLACFNLGDSIVSQAFGVFRASGQQSTGALLNFFTQV